MKTWNTPEVGTLNVRETENGFFSVNFETFILFGEKCDKKAESTPSDDPVVDNEITASES